MKGYRFYKEYNSPREKHNDEGNGNVTAIYLENGVYYSPGVGACYEAATGIFPHPNSDVCSSSVSLEWLRTNCKRISEEEARTIHPALFAYLEG